MGQALVVGREKCNNISRAGVVACALTTLLLTFCASAQAAALFHPREKTLDVAGLNHPCGVAVDSKGDLYASSAGESKIKVYDASHSLLTEIADANLSCGLAVTTTGNLYVSERSTGEVVRFKPNAYPFSGTPTYGAREVIDASGKARGIAVDPFDNTLYVAAGDHVAVYDSSGAFKANLGEGLLNEASGVAAFGYSFDNGLTSGSERYLWVADADGFAADRLYLLRGAAPASLTLRKELTGSATPDGSFGFGTAGAYLAEDPGNRTAKGECKALGGQACTAGHLFLYDAAHRVLDEFDASGRYLDRTAFGGFADAEQTAVAIDRSGGAHDGTLYVTARAGAGAKAFAFGPLKAPSRKTLGEPPAHVLTNARAVATDSHGDLYAAAGSSVRIYDPTGKELAKIEDPGKPFDLALDSTGKVYVLDENEGFNLEYEVTYYAPSKYPPESGTTYLRHEEPVFTGEELGKTQALRGIAVNPGPSAGKDRLLVTGTGDTKLFDSAANGSKFIGEFAKGLTSGTRQSIAVDGASGNVYLATNPEQIYIFNEAGKLLGQFDDTGLTSGTFGADLYIGVDQANGHVVEFDGANHSAREYDSAGVFVAELGSFTEKISRKYRVAIDSACALQEPPLTGEKCEKFDPSNGNVYIAFDDSKAATPDVWAFGPLSYPEPAAPPKFKLTVERTGTGTGTVASVPVGIECPSKCSTEYEEETEVTLTAKAGEKSELKSWSGCEAETVAPVEGTCKVTLSEAKKVTAEFESTETPEEELKVVIEGPGSGTVTSEPSGIIECPGKCSAKLAKKAQITLTATANSGSEFELWTGCNKVEPSTAECEVEMTEPKTVTVKFGPAHPRLEVKDLGSGTGTVTSQPAGIVCGATCSTKFTVKEVVTLKAVVAEGSKFTGWTGCDSEPSETECKVEMSAARKVTATFVVVLRARLKSAFPVLYDEATLRGEIDPAEFSAEYLFEYLTENEYLDNGEAFEGAIHTPMGSLKASKGFVAVAVGLSGLAEGTKYRYRLRTQNAAPESIEVQGTFETLQRRPTSNCPNVEYRFGLSAGLPDCRAYELVTPAQTGGLAPAAVGDGGTDSGTFSNWLTPQRGGAAGERLSYFTGGTLPGFEGNGVLDGYRAVRGADVHPEGGWQSVPFSPGYVESAPGIHHFALQHGVAGDQLYSIWEINPEPEAFAETLPHGVYLRTPSGFEPIAQGSLGTDLEALSRYVSPGGDHVIFASKAHLEPTAAPAGTQAIYDRAAGVSSAEVISVGPDGSAFGAGQNASYAGTIEDGSAVAFSVAGNLYLHRAGTTFAIAPSPSTFAGISEDGKRIFYAATANGEAAAPLYVCDTGAGSCMGSGSHPASKIADSGVFALVSPDGSTTFFTSTEALTGSEENDNGESAIAGKHNLYSWDGTDTRFVARLATADFSGFTGIGGMNLGAWTKALETGAQAARVIAPTRSTPDGGSFVFQSHARLTSYDNEGKGEIYRFDPTAPAGERLLCVSCDPTGAPPSADALLEDARFGVHSPIDRSTAIANLTDDGGAVFFQSFDRLLPEDANEAEDVYEWQAAGSGECTRPDGCLALISSGQGEVPSFLYAMSADGRDVFIQTKEKLVGLDAAGSPSIYDVREGGGIPEPFVPSPCQGDDCQGQGSEPPVLPSPTTTGGGEIPEPPGTPAPCAKGKHRVHGKCKPAKHHKRHHHRTRRRHFHRGGNR